MVILANWLGGVRFFRGMPGGLVAIIAGTVIAWVSNALGPNYGGLTLANLGTAFSNFGFSYPMPATEHVFGGFQYMGIILVTAIPFGIYDLVEAMDNVESAAVAGDAFPTTRLLTADGVISLTGCLMMALTPVIAILSILLYIGMLIGAQAFQEPPRSHAPAIMLALVPQASMLHGCAKCQRRLNLPQIGRSKIPHLDDV